MARILNFLGLLLAIISHADGYSSGAPSSACRVRSNNPAQSVHMRPGHTNIDIKSGAAAKATLEVAKVNPTCVGCCELNIKVTSTDKFKGLKIL